jgi:hypothetical protein
MPFLGSYLKRGVLIPVFVALGPERRCCAHLAPVPLFESAPMIEVISALNGFSILASDSPIGHVSDFLFDDVTWKVRWLVVDCGSWLKGRKQLIHPSAVSFVDLEREHFEVKLTRAQIESGPELAEHEPVSLQMQRASCDYYGWDSEWDGIYTGRAMGAMSSPLLMPPYFGMQGRTEPRSHVLDSPGGDRDLRSVVEVIGYRIHATDGEIGHLENFMLDHESWTLPHFVVDVSNWWFGRRVVMSRRSVISINWPDRSIFVDASRKQVKASSPWDPLLAFGELEKTVLQNQYRWPGSAA